MTCIINAVSGTGITQTADGSGQVKLQANGVTTNALAWMNFNGIVTTSIRASYNVSSVTRNGTGDYTMNFTNALTDANYCAVGSVNLSTFNYNLVFAPNYTSAPTTSAFRFVCSAGSTTTFYDCGYINVAIFGN